jgi:hypothetical protein
MKDSFKFYSGKYFAKTCKIVIKLNIYPNKLGVLILKKR